MVLLKKIVYLYNNSIRIHLSCLKKKKSWCSVGGVDLITMEGKDMWCQGLCNSKLELVREMFALTQAEMELPLKPGCSFVC